MRKTWFKHRQFALSAKILPLINYFYIYSQIERIIHLIRDEVFNENALVAPNIIFVFEHVCFCPDCNDIVACERPSGRRIIAGFCPERSVCCGAVQMRTDIKNKRYYILINDIRKGPYHEVIDLQATSESGVFVYAARIDTVWYVYEGNRQYGPFSHVSKVRTGDANHRCMFLAQKNKARQGLYNREHVLAGQEILSDCYDYELSANGRNTIFYMSGLMADYILRKDEKTYGSYGQVNNMKISHDGKDVGFFCEINPMEQIMKGGKNRYTGFADYLYPFISDNYYVKDSFGLFKTPGDCDFRRDEDYPVYFYSFQDTNGVWKLFQKDQDLEVKERDIICKKALPDGGVTYVAKPAGFSSNIADTTQYYVYVAHHPVGGPYRDVRQIIPSENASSLAVEARTDAGWFLILPIGGIGPFEDIQPATFLGESAVAFNAKSDGEWKSLLVNPAGMNIGCILKDGEKAVGAAFVAQGNINIYMQ
jgi:hypothetical protein